MSFSIKACNDACALNNMGVAMMQRGAFEHAVSTLKDALSIMRTILDCESSESTTSIPQGLHEFVQNKMQAASFRLSKMSSSAATTPSSMMTPPTDGGVQLNTIESNDFESLKSASLPTASSLQQQQQQQRRFSAVLIRDSCTAAAVSQTQLNREWGIVLFNYGLACYFLTTDSQQQHQQASVWQMKRDYFLSIAHKSLIMSQRTFTTSLLNNNNNNNNSSSNHQDNSANSQPDTQAEDVESIFLTMLVLSSTGKFLRAHDQHDKAAAAEEALGQLLQAAQEDHSALLSSTSPQSNAFCAAAAA